MRADGPSSQISLPYWLDYGVFVGVLLSLVSLIRPTNVMPIMFAPVQIMEFSLYYFYPTFLRIKSYRYVVCFFVVY
jgi:hypothetical protein